MHKLSTGFISTATGLGVSFFETSMPILQWISVLVLILIGILTIISKIKDIRK
jgi:ABC-type nickel/cobalt efflux system permease component RcnA